MAKKSVKFNIPEMPTVDMEKGVSTIKRTATQLNDFVLETSDQLVDRGIKRGSQWQDVSSKAIQGGFKLASNQQEIFFDALETFKVQVTKRSKQRIAGFFSKN